MEYIGRRLIVVYVGAIAVLFRFVVMMLNVSGAEARVISDEEEEASAGRRTASTVREDSVSRIVVTSRFGRTALVLEEEVNQVWREHVTWVDQRDPILDIQLLGQTLYTHGIYYVLIAGRVLLVGMLGAIVLTLQTGTRALKTTWKKQQVNEQISRDADKAVRLVSNRDHE